jgi:hypothetical protein
MKMPDPMSKKCSAHNRAGGSCGLWAMRGQNVCNLHGGKSPQALAKAEERMRALVYPSVGELGGMIHHADSDAVRLNAIKYILDWAGFKAAVEQQVDQQITIRVIDETQPIVLEQVYELNGRADG